MSKRISHEFNPGVWRADIVLETLNLADNLAEREYKTLMELKRKRNSSVHEGSMITRDDASECLNLAPEILRHEIEDCFEVLTKRGIPPTLLRLVPRTSVLC